MNWKDRLSEIAKEFNLEEVSDNVHTRSDSGRSSGISNRRVSGDVHRSDILETKSVKTDINTKGDRSMIPSKGLFDDYNIIDKEQIPVAEKVWKFIPKLLKLTLNTRTNTVKIMDKLGIPRETEETRKPKTQEPPVA